jgi:vancomycin resistance protein YoaR
VTTTPDAPAEGSGSDHLVRRTVLVLVIGLAALTAVFLGLVAASGDGLPRGATVLGVPVGGQSEAQAAATLEEELGPRAEAPVTVVVDGETLTIAPADAGLAFDAEATVAGQSGRTWNPVVLVGQFLGGPELEPVITVDEAVLGETIAGIAAETDEPAVEPAIEFRGTEPSLNPGVDGNVLDQPASVSAVAAAYLVSQDPVTLPVVVAPPTVDAEAADEALAAATDAVSAPVTVTVGTTSAQVPVTAIAEALTYAPVDGALAPALDGDVLRESIRDQIEAVESPGRDATWDVSSGKPVVVPSRVGKGVNPDQLAEDVLDVLDETAPTSRVIVARIGTIEPDLTTEEAKALGVVERLSSFKQNFPYAPYRSQNIGQAAEYIDGTLLEPGEVFSLNKTIKERTPANGYTKGFVVGPGGIFREDLGGGVSASATTVWTAAFFAGLQRVETRAHSIYISRYQAGLEATVAWGVFDMRFKNNTPNGVFITTDMRDTSLTVTMWGTKQYDEIRDESSPRRNIRPFTVVYEDSPECRPQSGVEGFTIDVFRVFISGGEEVKREKITTTYRPSPTVRCGVDPATKPKPSPSKSGTASPKPSGTAKPNPSTTPKPKPSPSPSTS